MVPVARVIVAGIALAGCEASGNSAPAYKLMKDTVAGQAEVGVIYGFIDNREFCSEIAEMYNKRYTAANLYCDRQ